MTIDKDTSPKSLIAIVTEAFGSPESVTELKKEAGGGAEIRLVAPAVAPNPLHDLMGDIDEPRVEARRRLDQALVTAKAAGLTVAGAEVGDSDPVQAAQDALFRSPADEIVFFSHAEDARGWYEGDLWRHAEDSLEPPLKLVVVDGGPQSKDHVVGVEESTPGHSNSDADSEVNSAYLPGLGRGDLVGLIAGIVGTIIVIVLAAAAATGGAETGWRAVAVGVAIATALINMAHVVGLLLMESVRYRGGFAKFFRDLAMFGTPIAIVVNLLILLFA
jgi:hypothetical protein